jgi:hypothetical protein
MNLILTFPTPSSLLIHSIEAGQRMMMINRQGEGINPAINGHLELEIKTLLQTAPQEFVRDYANSFN